MFDRTRDARVRAAAFEWLSEQVLRHGDVLPRAVLQDGFPLDGGTVHLIGPQGIFRPRVLSHAPLSITTAPNGPYDDSFGTDGLLRYRYRGVDPGHVDNRRLRFAMEHRLPLVYFHGLIPGRYLATWPVFVVRDDPAGLVFSVVVDDAAHMAAGWEIEHGRAVESEADAMSRRRYVTAAARVRLHQRAFRERVLEAYRHQCAFCRLRHTELLDAAHIIPDAEVGGEPVVQNGLALCSLHHSAFDRYFIGVRPDFRLEVREDIRHETDGPTLRHAIQALHGSRLHVPGNIALRPCRDLIEVRYERFLAASVR